MYSSITLYHRKPKQFAQWASCGTRYTFPLHRGEARRNWLKFRRVTQRKENTRLQGSLFQFISCYSPEIQVLILYHCNPIQTLIWHPLLGLPVVVHVCTQHHKNTVGCQGFYICSFRFARKRVEERRLLT